MKCGLYTAHQRCRPNSAVSKDGRETPLRQTPINNISRYVLQYLYMYGNLQRFHSGFFMSHRTIHMITFHGVNFIYMYMYVCVTHALHMYMYIICACS